MKTTILNVFILVMFMSCSDKAPQQQQDRSAVCFEAYDYRYEDLLTKADVAKHVQIDEASFKKEVSPVKGFYGSCQYKWESGRPNLEKEIAGHVFSFPDFNSVSIKHLKFYSTDELDLYSHSTALSLFDQSYKKLSENEYNELLANLEKEYAGDAAGFEQAKGFLDQRMQFTYEIVEHLGDRAYWKWSEDVGIELVVLSGTTHFTIESKTHGTSGPSLDDAVKIAREVLAKCNT